MAIRSRTCRSIVTKRHYVVIGLVATVLLIHYTCAWELFLPSSKRALSALKNRTAIPAESHYDPAVTLEAMIRRGADRDRWSSLRAARIEGYVVDVHDAGIELANCLSFSRRDAHVEVALRPNAPARARVILEVTPPIRDWATQQGMDWSTTTLQRDLIGRRVRFEGWLLFDTEHDYDSENIRPGRTDNFRATAWEIHPITSIAIIK